MISGFDIITRLTSASLPDEGRERIFKDFAQILGWEPSDNIKPTSDLNDISNGHLIVDHGLENSAVITFLISPTSFSSLNPQQLREVLSISYNNLIDWHIVVEQERVTYVFNRLDPLQPQIHFISQSNIESLKSTMFDQITGKTQNPNFPTLDNALIENISFWKRYLAAELNNIPKLTEYSILFNSLIFVRAVEDHAHRLGVSKQQVLIEEFNNNQQTTIRKIVERSLNHFLKDKKLENLIDFDKLEAFDNLNKEIIYDLLISFYKNRKIPYSYDFAIMSKHALSRIYEHYVSALRFEESPQLSFFPIMPLEKQSKSFGSVYTPQFIAKFFAKYIREQLTPGVFRKMKILDPACGSGIFLRTLAEYQNSSNYDVNSSNEITNSFKNIVGIDIDDNAVQATKLSLSLLYLVLMSGELPSSLDIITGDALDYIGIHKERLGKFDVVVANPPFISSENQSEKTRESISKYLDDLSFGKIDSYLPFIKLSLDVLKPGGYGMLVLPHTFLKLESASKIRSYILKNSWIKCIIDLSTIPVFKDHGTYVILFIFQKKPEKIVSEFLPPPATLVLCKDFVGHALQDCLEGNMVENEFYSIYTVPQEKFLEENWSVLPPSQLSIISKLSKFSLVKDILQVNQGIITGADEVFIIPRTMVPNKDGLIWSPLLRDRDMQKYSSPRSSQFFVFYPYIDGNQLSFEEIQEKFPDTCAYLNSKKDVLTKRKLPKDKKWWNLIWPRDPNLIFSSKLVTPHLMLLPKFSFDEKGKFLVSHSPYLTAREGFDNSFLKFYLGIFNSSIGAWLLSTHSDHYSRGYARLEVKTLGNLPIPDPSRINSSQLTYFLELVDRKIKGDTDNNVDREIDKEVASFYSLSNDDLTLGLGFFDA